ncbi:MAG TPA: M48 family metallopeptidase, partial [Burkholderiaceae bacterium]
MTTASASIDPTEMQHGAELRKGLLKTLWQAVLLLFLVPAVAFAFVSYVDWSLDRHFFAEVEQELSARNVDSDKLQTVRANLHAHPPSAICQATPEELTRFYGEADCSAGSTFWQFNLARQLALISLAVGLATLLAVGVLGRVAFINRRWQYGSLMVGWRMLMATSVVQVLIQGALAVWLAFWLPAYFFERYSIKLIGLAGIIAGGAALVVIARIFHRPQSAIHVEGERLSEAAAPRLWQRVREIAERLKTAAPDQIVGGIDANFFVTQMPVTIANEVLHGRTLFVSIPLLRIMSTGQADAVLGHELAHFSGGDTDASARLNPALQRYDHYLSALREGGMSLVVFPIMNLYRLLLQLAMSRESREREFKADRTAASVTSPQAVIEALVKVAAYSTYRGKTEEALIARQERLDDQLGLGASVAHGLLSYAASEQFADEMRSAPIPHPFDSHPPMAQRMQNVGHQLDVSAFCDVVSVKPDTCWVDEINGADQIEERLWAAYERR